MTQKSSEPNNTVVYANFGRRLLAFFIDGVVLFFINFVLTLLVGKTLSAYLGILANWAYLIYFIGSRGQTLGKMAMNIKVVNVQTNLPPGYLAAFLREVVGRFLSSIVFLLGYLWMLWDPKKQTWHDKIAKTIVIMV